MKQEEKEFYLVIRSPLVTAILQGSKMKVSKEADVFEFTLLFFLILYPVSI